MHRAQRVLFIFLLPFGFVAYQGWQIWLEHSARIHVNEGKKKAQAGDTDGALADFTRAIANDPTMARAFFYRGRVYNRRKEWQLAAADFTAALERDMGEDNGLVYTSRAIANNGLGKPELAFADLTEAIRIDPSNWLSYSIRADIRNLREDVRGSLADYDKAIELGSDQAGDYFQRGRMHLKIGQRMDAVRDFQKAAQMDPALKTKIDPLIPILSR